MGDNTKMVHGLGQKRIEKIHSVFERFDAVDTVILYGSRAKGNHKAGSDIDLAVKGKRVTLHTLNRISNELDDLLLPYIFDLTIYHHISNPQLLAHINRVGIVFFSR